MVTLDISPKSEKKIKYLLAQQPDNESFINEIIDHKIRELNRANVNLKADIVEFERKYGMTSSDFYQRFSSGEMGDEDDMMVWAGIYEMLTKNKHELKNLEW